MIKGKGDDMGKAKDMVSLAKEGKPFKNNAK